MVNRKKATNPIQLTNALQTIYTVPVGVAAKDITFDFLNTDAAASVGITLHLVPAAGTPGDSNKLFSETSPGGLVLSAQEWRSVPIDQALSAGDMVQAKAAVTLKVTMHTTVTEVS